VPAKPGGGGGGYPWPGLNMGTPPGCGGDIPEGIPIPMGGIGTVPGTGPGGCMDKGVNPGGGGGAAASAPAN